MQPLNDAEASRVGDVFEAHSRFIESVASRHSQSPAHVPDIVQTVGLHVCRKLRGFRGDAAITTWLYSITVHTAIDYWRHERKHDRVREALLTHQPGVARQASPDAAVRAVIVTRDRLGEPEAELSRRERAAALRAAIQTLRPNQAALMGEELDGTPVLSDSKSVRHRARRKLREVLAADPGFA